MDSLAQDPEKMKSLIAFKKRMEEQLEKLTAETKEIQAALDTVNGILLEKASDEETSKKCLKMPRCLKRLFCQNQSLKPPKVIIQHAPEAQLCNHA